METTEKIVESYCRYVKNFFTISNIKIKNNEIDLLAVDTSRKTKIIKYHIEISVSIASSFSTLTAKEFSEDKYRKNKAAQRRTMGFFIEKKFSKPEFAEKLKMYGFEKGQYQKVIVTWGWTEAAKKIADKNKIILWDFRDIIAEIGEFFKDDKTYFRDDTLRTIQLYILAARHRKKNNGC